MPVHSTTPMDSLKILANVRNYHNCIANACKWTLSTRNALATLARTWSQVTRTFSCALRKPIYIQWCKGCEGCRKPLIQASCLVQEKCHVNPQVSELWIGRDPVECLRRVSQQLEEIAIFEKRDTAGQLYLTYIIFYTRMDGEDLRQQGEHRK